MDSKASEKNRSIPNIAIFSLVVSSASIFAVLAIVVWFSQKFSDIKQEQILLRSNAPNLQQTLTPVQNKIDQNEKGIHTLRDKAEKMESRMDALKTELSSAADHLSKLQTKFLEKEQTPTQTDTIEKHQKQIDELNQKIKDTQKNLDDSLKNRSELKPEDLIKLQATLKKEFEQKMTSLKQEISEKIESMQTTQKETLTKLKDQVWSKFDDVKQEQTKSARASEENVFREFAQLYINRMQQAIITGESYKTDLELLHRHFKNQWPLSDKDTDFLRKYQTNIPWKNDGQLIKAYYDANPSKEKSKLNSILKYVEQIARIKVKPKEKMESDFALTDSVNEIKKLRQKFLEKKHASALSKTWLEDVDHRLKINDLIYQIEKKAKTVRQETVG